MDKTSIGFLKDNIVQSQMLYSPGSDEIVDAEDEQHC